MAIAIGVVTAAVGAPAQPAPLTEIADISVLSDAVAGNRLPVAIEGVVTAVEDDWRGQFFVQDATGGIWIEYYGDAPPSVGDKLAITGVTHPGAFAPIVAAPSWKTLGAGPLPPARRVPIEDLVLGVYDGQRVEVEGLVRSATRKDGHLQLVLAIGGYRLEVRIPADATDHPDSLIGATIRARGPTATHYNSPIRQLTGVAVYATVPGDFAVVDVEDANPFQQPVIAINRVAQHRVGMGAKNRVHLRAVVTSKNSGSTIFVQDATAGLRIVATNPDSISVGESVDVVGFLEFENHLPFLNDAILRPAAVALEPIEPKTVSVADIRKGLHHGEMIYLEGKVLDRTARPVLNSEGRRIGNAVTWLIQGAELSFTIELESTGPTEAADPAPIGSAVRASGVCFSTIDEPVALKSLRLLIAAPSQIRVLKRPSWLTPARLGAGLAVITFLLVIAIAWSLTVSRKNKALKVLVREKQEAQDQLREANENLEQKVIERSNQLQQEMSARKAARLEFKAVISERTRLARDLHDTLEQSLTGIALQLDTAKKLFESGDSAAHQHVRRARHWLQQSQVALRHSIWDLRSRELEQFDLAAALSQNVDRLAESAQANVHFSTTGEKQRLSEVVEENVLRILQEAMTNIAKHARAQDVWVELRYEAKRLTLTVKDNGVGFDFSQGYQLPDNHYGLLGMRERASRLNGELRIDSQVGAGVTLSLSIPIEPRPVGVI